MSYDMELRAETLYYRAWVAMSASGISGLSMWRA